MAIDRIVQHRHCINCGRAVPGDKQYCSDNCEEEYVTSVKKKKMLVYVNYAFIFVLVVLFVLFYS